VLPSQPTIGPFTRFADRLLTLELPDLPNDRRLETVLFIERRVEQMPSPLRVGTTVLIFGLGLAQRVCDVDKSTAWLQSVRIPFVGELARLVRSLGLAYIWETWPNTTPSGMPAEGVNP
jgi:hypothetical protein